MRVLIVEDEKNLAKVLKKGLEESGFVIDIASDGEEGFYMANEFPFDALILDISLPKLDGLSILGKLREKGSKVPVLMLTARADVADKIKGLNTGADDYLAKPFDFAELLARLNSLLRRSKNTPSPVIKISDLEIDTNAREVCRSNKKIKLSSSEFNILEYLALNRGRVISRAELTDHIYNIDFDLDSNIIDVYINYLRNKIDKGYIKPLIHTIRGSGYILAEK